MLNDEMSSGMPDHQAPVLCLLAAALLIAAGGALAADESPADLLHNARVWEMKSDAGRERAELVKLLNADPKHVQGLLMRGLLEVRSGRVDLAGDQLQQLKAVQPAHPAVAQLEEALRIAGKDSKRMAMVRLLVRSGKTEEAAAGMRTLFPKAPPLGNDLALEYYRVIGNTPKGAEEARRGLEKLVRAEPDDWRYQMALGQQLGQRPATRRAGVQTLAALAKRPEVDRAQVLEAWRQSLLALERSPDNTGLYRDYLAADPENADVRNALDGARRAEAERQPWLLRDRADEQLKQGHPEEAMATLKSALQLAPKNPWVRYDLARLYYKRGAASQGRALMEEGIALAPNDADMLHAAALYLGGMDEANDALRLLDRIAAPERSASIKRLSRRLLIQSQAQQAKQLLKDGNRAAAVALLEQAATDAHDDAELVNDVANAWLELGEQDRAVALMQRLLARQKVAPASLRLRYALLLNRAERDKELAAQLQQLAGSKGLAETERQDLRYLQASLAARRADNLRHAGNVEAARAVLIPALQQDPENTDLLRAMARVHLAAHEPGQAIAIDQGILQRRPGDMAVRLDLMRTLNDANDQAGAQREAQTILAGAADNDVDTRLTLAEWYLDNKDAATARRVVDPLRKAAPDNQRVLLLSARIARAEGDYAESVGYFKQARADDEVARMEKNRAAYVVTAGVDYLTKSDGVSGISNLTLIEMPLELRMPVGYAGDHAFMQIDPVSANAGELSGDLNNLGEYGKVKALSPTSVAASTQSAQGTALGVGYERGDIRADIGTTPIGFPVTDVTGGVKWSHYTETTGFSLDVSRRALTSTLLAYAGVHDPVTGEIWGGVRSNGASLHLSQDFGRLGAFVDVGYYVLTGRNVLTNTELALRTGADWSFIQDDDMRLSAGLALTNWRYKENLRYYTFGHGGYYSPQNYVSLALPFRWTGRAERWSYLLKGALSTSVSYEKDMDYYPTDAALQSLVGNTIYAGGHGTGNGYSVGGALEYKATQHLFVGGRFDIDRSEYYSPNFAIVYLRYLFDAHTGPVPYPPDPVKAYTRY